MATLLFQGQIVPRNRKEKQHISNTVFREVPWQYLTAHSQNRRIDKFEHRLSDFIVRGLMNAEQIIQGINALPTEAHVSEMATYRFFYTWQCFFFIILTTFCVRLINGLLISEL